MKEMFTDSDPMRSDDFKLPADGMRYNAPGNKKPIRGCPPPSFPGNKEIGSMITNVEFALNAIHNETAIQVCCGRPGQECCGLPDVDWPSWATEIMTKLSDVRSTLIAFNQIFNTK